MKQDSISNIGCRWMVCPDGDYIILDVHHTGFRPGTPAFRKLMQRADGSYYIIHRKVVWNF